MPVFWRRAVFLLVIVIAVLQVIHMALLSRLEAKRQENKRRRSRGLGPDGTLSGDSMYGLNDYKQTDIEEDRKRMLRAVKESSVLDSSGEFHIINFFVRAQSLGPRNFVRQDLSLVTQSSVSQMGHLETITNRWHGLVSVTVFSLTPDIPLAVEAILLLRRCHPVVRYNTSFHFVYPLRVPPPLIGATSLPQRPSTAVLSNEENCEKMGSLLEALQPGVLNYALSGVPYPNNLLRNVARRNALTEYIFMIDIDLAVSERLHETFLQFARENRLFLESQKEDKTVYVIPAYEVKADIAKELIPRDKTSLLQLVELMEARPFYFELCWKCQKHTDYETWQREPLAPQLAVLFEILWRDPWEPFYIGRNSVPYYDERFRQYGFNRISQVCELHMAGYKFSVLNNAFVVHKGLKTPDSFHREKDLEQERNRVLFRQFKAELKDKYPDSSRRCY